MVHYSCDYVYEAVSGDSYKLKCLDCWFSLTNNTSQTIYYNFNNAMQGIENLNTNEVWVCCSPNPTATPSSIVTLGTSPTLLSSLSPDQQDQALIGSLSSGNNCWNKIICFVGDVSTLQVGSVPLLTIAGSPVNFWFWSGGGGPKQYINILGSGAFAITENSDSQNVAVGMGFSITLNSGGGNAKTNNICITVTDCPGAYSLGQWLGNYPQTVYSPWAQPPSLTIQSLENNNYQIELDGTVINNWSYDATTSLLSWSAEDGNWSAASLTFSLNSKNQATFTGNLQMVAPESPTSGTFSGTVSNVV